MPMPGKTSNIAAVSGDVLILQNIYVQSFNYGLTKSG